MSTPIIKELQTAEEVQQGYPVMKQLRTHLDEEAYMDLVLEAQVKDRYKIFALFEEEKIVAVTGFKPMITLCYGRFVWVCDLVTDSGKIGRASCRDIVEVADVVVEREVIALV